MKQFESVFELFNFSIRKLANGDMLQIVLEKPFTEEEQKKLVDFFDKDVQVKIKEYVPPGEKITTVITIDDIFHIPQVSLRKLANGNKTRFVIDKVKDLDNLRRCVDLFEKDVQIFMEVIQNELQLEGTTDGELDELVIPEEME